MATSRMPESGSRPQVLSGVGNLHHIVQTAPGIGRGMVRKSSSGAAPGGLASQPSSVASSTSISTRGPSSHTVSVGARLSQPVHHSPMGRGRAPRASITTTVVHDTSTNQSSSPQVSRVAVRTCPYTNTTSSLPRSNHKTLRLTSSSGDANAENNGFSENLNSVNIKMIKEGKVNVIRVDSLGRKRCESLSGELLPHTRSSSTSPNASFSEIPHESGSFLPDTSCHSESFLPDITSTENLPVSTHTSSVVPDITPTKSLPVSTRSSSSSGNWRKTSKSLPLTFHEDALFPSAIVDLHGCDTFLNKRDDARGSQAGGTLLTHLAKHTSFGKGCDMVPAPGGKALVTGPTWEELESTKTLVQEVTRILKPFVLHNHHLVDLGKFDARTGAMLMEEGKRTKFALPAHVLQDIQTGRLYVLIQDISAGRHSQLVDTIVCLAETLRKIQLRLNKKDDLKEPENSPERDDSGYGSHQPSPTTSERPAIRYSRNNLLALYSSPLSSCAPVGMQMLATAVDKKPFVNVPAIVECVKNQPSSICPVSTP